MDQNGVLAQTVKAAVIRDIAEGIVPDRQNVLGWVPFNLMKFEKLVWVMTDVDYVLPHGNDKPARRCATEGDAGQLPGHREGPQLRETIRSASTKRERKTEAAAQLDRSGSGK